MATPTTGDEWKEGTQYGFEEDEGERENDPDYEAFETNDEAYPSPIFAPLWQKVYGFEQELEERRIEELEDLVRRSKEEKFDVPKIVFLDVIRILDQTVQENQIKKI